MCCLSKIALRHFSYHLGYKKPVNWYLAMTVCRGRWVVAVRGKPWDRCEGHSEAALRRPTFGCARLASHRGLPGRSLKWGGLRMPRA